MSDEKTPAETPKLDIKATHAYREWKHDAPLLGCRYDPTAKYVFAASFDHKIYRWDLAKDTQTAFAGHDSWLRGIGFSLDGKAMYSAGYDGRICFWETEAVTTTDKPVAPVKTIDAHHGWIRWLAVHPDGDTIATAGNDLEVKLWSASDGALKQTLAGHEKQVWSLLFHPDGETLLSGDLKGVVNQWELATGKLQRSFDAKALYTYHKGQQVDYGGVRCMRLSPDGKELACGGLHKATNPFAGVQEPLVLVFDWESGKQLRTHEATGIPRGIVWRLWYEADGTLVSGVGGQEGYLVFWKADKNDFHKLKMRSPVLDLDHHPQKPEVSTAHYDGQLKISKLTTKT